MFLSRILATYFIIAFSAFALTNPATSWAHGSEEDEAHTDAIIELYQKVIDFTPDIVGEQSLSVPSVRISGQTIYLNGPFWELVQDWIRIYYRELQSTGERCIQWNEADFMRLAQDEIARSFIGLKVKDPLLESLEHIVVGTADLGGELGTGPLVVKAASEVGETVVSKVVGGGGVHVVCHLIDASIIFGTRYFQTRLRTLLWSSTFDSSGVANLVRTGFVSSAITKAQKRVRFEHGPIEVNEEELRALDLEGPNRWWGWARDGKRAKWLRKFAKLEPEQSLSLSKKKFLGQRFKRFLLLKGRKRGFSRYLKGSTPMDKVLNKDVLWVLSVQENMVQRAFAPQGDEPQLQRQSLADTQTLRQDEIRRGLAEEFATGDPLRADLVENLLKEVEVIFNPSVSRKLRYFQTGILETLLTGFTYQMFAQVLDERGEMYGHSLRGIWRQTRLHWKVSRVGYYIYEWSDFLRLAALQTDPETLAAYRYEAMESLLRVFRYLQSTRDILKADSIEDLLQFENEMAGQRKPLLTSFRPWKEKKMEHSWFPWRDPKPLCRDMNLKPTP